MTNFQSQSLDKKIRRRLSLSEGGANPTPTLQTERLAEDHETTPEYVMERMAQLNVNAPKLGQDAE